MFKARIIPIALTIAFELSSLGAATARADEIFTNGKALNLGEIVSLNSKAGVAEPVILRAPTLSLKLSCSKLSSAGAKLTGINKYEAASLDLSSCSEIEPRKCTVVSSIPTEPIVGTFSAGIVPNDLLAIAPKTGTLISAIEFFGTCSLAGEKALVGRMNLRLPTGQDEAASQAIEGLGSSGGNSLELAGNKAFIEKGKTALRLASGSSWSFGAAGGNGAGLTPENGGLLEFGKVTVGSTATKTETFTDTSFPEVSIGSHEIFNSPIFEVVKDGCSGKTLKSFEKCSIEVRFEPKEKGEYFGSVWLLAPGAGIEATVELEGTGT